MHTRFSYHRRAARLFATLGLILGCLACFVACPVPFTQPSASSGGASSLKLSVGPQSSRTIVAGSSDYSSAIVAYMVTISNVDHTYTSTTVTAGVCTITDMIAGSYTVTVQAYSDAGRTTQIALGTTTVALSSAATKNASVTLSFLQSANSGGYSLQVAWPVGTALPYVCARLDSTVAAYTPVQGTSDGTNYRATIAASNLSGGAHVLYLYFKASSASTTLYGPYVESLNVWDGVTDKMWADPSGNLFSTLSLGAGDFFNPDATLAGLSISGGPSLTTAFSPTTYAYNFTGGSLTTGTSYPFAIATQSASQIVAVALNGTNCPLSATSPTTLTGSFTAVSGLNTLAVTVMATDRKTSRIYAATTGLIASSADLAIMATNLTCNYALSADIDTTTSGNWTPIGSTTAEPFTGTFDGAGHTITISIPSYSGDGAALFYQIGSSGLVKNVKVAGTITSTGNHCAGIVGENAGTIIGCTSAVNITNPGSSHTGGIAGASNGGTISYCVSTGSIAGNYHTGGIVGVDNANGIDHCYTTGTISGNYGVGGIVGEWAHGTIDQCYSVASVTAGQYGGGLIGDLAGTGLGCSDSYARGAVAGGSCGGGFIGGYYSGKATFTNCYATGTATGYVNGYFVGSDPGNTYALCYVANSAGGSFYLSTLNAAVPAGWNAGVWGWNATINNGYPYLLYFGSGTQVP